MIYTSSHIAAKRIREQNKTPYSNSYVELEDYYYNRLKKKYKGESFKEREININILFGLYTTYSVNHFDEFKTQKRDIVKDVKQVRYLFIFIAFFTLCILLFIIFMIHQS